MWLQTIKSQEVLETISEKISQDIEKEMVTEIITTTETETINLETKNYQNKFNTILNVTPLSQYPELATGCEITSLTMALNYMDVPADKCDLADNYLDKGPVGKTDFRVAFEGDPRDGNSYGCYAPVIKKAADKYLNKKGSNLSAKDLTGSELEELFTYIDNEIPVIVWGTLDCRKGHYSVTWHVNGKDLTWFTPEHCMVLVGYDDSTIWVADPSHGDIRSYDRATFKDRYNSLQKQAVIIS